MNRKTEIIGYHGTSLDDANKIVKSNFDLNLCISEEHWLGQGVYLFENKELANWWAKIKKEIPCTLKVTYSAPTNKIADLTEPNEYGRLVCFFDEWEKDIRSLNPGHRVVFESIEKKRCALFDSFKKNYNIEVLINYFPKDKASYLPHISNKVASTLSSMNIFYQEKQICITSIEIIGNIEKLE